MRTPVHLHLLVLALEAALLSDEETAAEWLQRFNPTLSGEELRQFLAFFRRLRALGWRPPSSEIFRG